MYRFLAVAIIGVIIGLTTGWKIQGWRKDNQIAEVQKTYDALVNKLTTTTLNAERTFRERERAYIISLSDAQEKRNEEVAAINQRHAALVHRLQQRPERKTAIYCPGRELPETPAACAGTTGKELARGDAEFLAGYAADAARLDAALMQCLAAYNSLTK